jgi:hypothetical protein
MSYPYPHLSTILNIYPQCDTHCYGYAPSKGRRCRQPTRKDNREHASRLLNYGTHLLQRGLPVDNLLIELAPLLLCSHQHKNQAGSLVGVWRARLQAVQEQWLLAAVLKSLSEYADSRARELAEQRVEGGDSRPTQPAVIETAEEEEEEEEEGGGEGDREESEPEPEPSPVRTPTETSASAVPSAAVEPSVPRSETRTITRKPIEGDCEICMCPLRGQDSGDDDEGSGDGDDEDDDDDDDETASDDEDDDPEEADDDLHDLVYCKDQCGTNYHKTCIDHWLATQSTFGARYGRPVRPSCPTCRAVWSS